MRKAMNLGVLSNWNIKPNGNDGRWEVDWVYGELSHGAVMDLSTGRGQVDSMTGEELPNAYRVSGWGPALSASWRKPSDKPINPP